MQKVHDLRHAFERLAKLKPDDPEYRRLDRNYFTEKNLEFLEDMLDFVEGREHEFADTGGHSVEVTRRADEIMAKLRQLRREWDGYDFLKAFRDSRRDDWDTLVKAVTYMESAFIKKSRKTPGDREMNRLFSANKGLIQNFLQARELFKITRAGLRNQILTKQKVSQAANAISRFLQVFNPQEGKRVLRELLDLSARYEAFRVVQQDKRAR